MTMRNFLIFLSTLIIVEFLFDDVESFNFGLPKQSQRLNMSQKKRCTRSIIEDHCNSATSRGFKNEGENEDSELITKKSIPEQNTLEETRTLPFSMIVGLKRIKEALILLASNPRIGGVLISGSHGTGKSVLARALHKILPKTIERIKGSLYNIDPFG